MCLETFNTRLGENMELFLVLTNRFVAVDNMRHYSYFCTITFFLWKKSRRIA